MPLLQRKIRVEGVEHSTMHSPASDLPTRFYPSGTRVGAFLTLSDGKAEFFGYGTLLDDDVPPVNGLGLSSKLHASGVKVPVIRIDNGDLVYGSECRWGEERLVSELLSTCTDVTVVEITFERRSNTRDSDPPPPTHASR